MKHINEWLITELWLMNSFMINLLILLQLTLVISNTWYIKLSSSSLVIQHLIKKKKKLCRYLETWYLEFFPMLNKFSSPLKSFLSLSQNVPKIYHAFFDFSSQTAVTVITRMSKDSPNLFLFFDLIFWLLEDSIKFLFKDHCAEIHGAFEMKSYQQNYLC